ncbi:hypothetical protein SARC_14153 [Sphaeroforma arctica JP610]|uniref:V-SNARE coiled-coil homology domain-containing protein n=1 Tax=Sphaeroforma arctica JP610 TaxID=667725 RepID=A0A0L0F9S4_9EUKA|nr:hypothetical protein SARC_14153 [Sphaeroforma arctica JP610]KNC73286.1 hypothetical protein SARC_14153 [Sphaeroforma arctica JP610]|eukprot:XP_014147188.1 hypothetical protein SARC_14153 [Sphaeroforma arctica JP610]
MGRSSKKDKSQSAPPPVTYMVTPPEEEEKRKQTDAKIARTQKNVDQVVDIMKDNVEKVLERDENISNLESQSEKLHGRTKAFKKTAKDVKVLHRNRYWKWVCLLISVCLFASLIIVLVLKPWN